MKNGNCYEVHANHLIDMRINKLSTKSVKLVHGLVTGQGLIKGKRYGHCWLEIGGSMVIDISSGKRVMMKRSRYYRIGKVKKAEVKRYTTDEVRKQLLETKHYGPWHDNIPPIS